MLKLYLAHDIGISFTCISLTDCPLNGFELKSAYTSIFYGGHTIEFKTK